MRRPAIIVLTLAIGAGLLWWTNQVSRSGPPTSQLQRLPPAPTYKLVAQQGVTVPGTDTPATVGVWIENGKDRYHPGDTLTLYFGMRYDGPGEVTVAAPDTAPIVSARVVLEGARYHGAPLVEFPSVDSLAAHYAASAKPSPAGWAIAWQPSSEQLTRIPRRVTIPVLNPGSPAWMGEAWTEVARIEIPHNAINWGRDISSKSSVYLEVLGARIRLYRNALEATY